MIKGWDKCIATMKEGEKCIVYLTPENAYGARGAPPDIPPNMPLVRALRVQTQTVRHIRGRIDAREILALACGSRLTLPLGLRDHSRERRGQVNANGHYSARCFESHILLF